MHSAWSILSSVACPALQYFSTYPINGTILGKKLLNIKCVFLISLQLLSETFLILRRNEREMIKKYILVFMYKVHPFTGTDALNRLYGPQRE